MTRNRKETVQRWLLKWIGAASIFALLLSAFGAASTLRASEPALVPFAGESFPNGISAEDRQTLEHDLKSLGAKLTSLRCSFTNGLTQLDHFADAALFQKGVI